MSFRDLFSDTLAALRAHKLRALLTMFGIAWGVISITLMVAAGQGLSVGLKRQAETLGKDLIIVFPGHTSLQAGGMRAGRLLHWNENDYIPVAEEAPACQYVLPEIGNQVAVRSRYNSGNLLVSGSLPPFAELRSIEVAEGRFYNESDNRQALRVAFLGSDAKKELFGARPALGETIWLGGIQYTVIGVMRAKDQDSSYDGFDVRKIYIPYSAMVRDFPDRPPAPPHTIDHLLVAPRSLAEHRECLWQVRSALGLLHHFNPHDKEAADVWDTIKDVQAEQKLTEGMKDFLGAIGIVTLALGGLGVMNVMLVAVRERTREIGLRKAVGGTRGSILAQFFVETLLIAFLSGGAGLGVAYGLCALVNLIPMPPFFAGLLPTWQVSAVSAALLALVAILAAMYPAHRAASVDPIEALRFEAGG
jgi:putative ABC transport system permease protein